MSVDALAVHVRHWHKRKTCRFIFFVVRRPLSARLEVLCAARRFVDVDTHSLKLMRGLRCSAAMFWRGRERAKTRASRKQLRKQLRKNGHAMYVHMRDTKSEHNERRSARLGKKKRARNRRKEKEQERRNRKQWSREGEGGLRRMERSGGAQTL